MPANVACDYSTHVVAAIKAAARERLAIDERLMEHFATDHTLCDCSTHKSSTVPVTLVGAKRERYGSRYRCLACGQVWRAMYHPLDD